MRAGTGVIGAIDGYHIRIFQLVDYIHRTGLYSILLHAPLATDIQIRFTFATTAVSKLIITWNRFNISFPNKTRLYWARVISALRLRQWKRSRNKCFRHLLHISWEEHKTKTLSEVWSMLYQKHRSTSLKQRWEKWLGSALSYTMKPLRKKDNHVGHPGKQ